MKKWQTIALLGTLLIVGFFIVASVQNLWPFTSTQSDEVEIDIPCSADEPIGYHPDGSEIWYRPDDRVDDSLCTEDGWIYDPLPDEEVEEAIEESVEPDDTEKEEVVEVEVGKPVVKPEIGKGVAPGTSTVQEIFRSGEALAYLVIQEPNASRQTVFPDVPHGDRPALVAYEVPFEDGDYCENTPCGMDVPQYYYRVMTAGQVTIPDLSVNCVATDTQGCLVIVINHFGETAMYRGNTIDHGFTIAGRVWDMSTPDNVTLVGSSIT